MQRIGSVFVILLISAFGLNIFAQNDRKIEQELNKLKLVLNRTSAFVDFLPQSDIRLIVLTDLQNANEEFRKAVDLANNNQLYLARVHIHLAYQYLKKIESLIKDHPIFRIKYRERLDSKIQQAEEIVQTSQNSEALHMLNRAKFFRQKAYLSFRNDQSYNALEYYRLAIFFADKAIQVAKSETDNMSRDWQDLLSETEMLIDRANQLVNELQNSQLQNMIVKANDEIQEIRRLYAAKRNNAANNKLLILHRSLYRIIDLAENIPQREGDRLSMDLETLKFTTQSLETDIESINSPAVNQLYFRVSNLVNNIENHIREGELALARQKIFLANRLILNIYRLIESKSTNSPDELNLQIERTKQNFSELQSSSANLSFSSELLRVIKTNLDYAENAMGEKNYIQASLYLKMANQLILKMNRLRLLQSMENVEKKSVEAELQRLESLINRINISQNPDQEFTIKYENSKRLYEIAQNAFSNNDLQLCQELTTMAINLITQ